jgi:hypothetical protein
MASAHTLTDHNEIRRWAERRGARPTCVKGTGRKGDTGMIRLDFPGYSGARSLQPISWNDWFKSFDENNLALLVQDRTARGQQSNFSKLVARKTAEGKQHSRRAGQGAGRRAASSSSSSRATTSKSRSSAGVRRSNVERATAADRSSRTSGRERTANDTGGSTSPRNGSRQSHGKGARRSRRK